MTTEALDQISAALRRHTEATDANNRQLAAQMQAIPGAAEALRRYLATRGMNSKQIESIVRCDIPAEALRGLLDLTAPKN
jgi:hypothetical protein